MFLKMYANGGTLQGRCPMFEEPQKFSSLLFTLIWNKVQGQNCPRATSHETDLLIYVYF